MAHLRSSLLLLALCANVHASGIVTVVCDNVVIANKVAFLGLNSPVIVCALGANGTASFNAEQTSAGNNFFLDAMTVVYDTSAEPQGTAHSATFTVTSTPTWIPAPKEPPPAVPTFLELDGRVQIPDTTATLDMNLLGELGGPFLSITTPQLTHANCTQCTLGIATAGNQFTDPTADEILSLSSVGRVVYRTSSPVFEGAIPEPSTLWFGLLGFVTTLFPALARRTLRRDP